MQNNCLEEVEILLTLISEVCIVFFLKHNRSYCEPALVGTECAVGSNFLVIKTKLLSLGYNGQQSSKL